MKAATCRPATPFNNAPRAPRKQSPLLVLCCLALVENSAQAACVGCAATALRPPSWGHCTASEGGLT